MNVPNRFDPASVGTFRVIDRAFDSESRTVSLGYGFDDGPTFVETLTFETKPGHDGTVDAPGLERALLHLHIAAGTSYYKTAAPSQVVVEGVGLAPAEIEFHRHLYDEGLREFAVANHLPVPHRLSIRAAHASDRPAAPDSFEREGGLLVPIGGGKDSMVLIEAVKHLHPRLFAVNPHPLVIELANQTGLELLVVRRRLSPQLGVLNRSGALNGHVPITALISLIAVVGSFLYGYDTIAMAIERSASEETVVVDGVPVNHQYSKSLDFEVLVQELISGFIDPDLGYGSALRPYSELAIARAFARLTGYHATFCSCNTAFRQTAGADDRLVRRLPEVSIRRAHAGPVPHTRMQCARSSDATCSRIRIRSQGSQPSMSDDDKPFECVGERRESAAAMRILSDRPDWKDTVVVASLADRARAMVSDERRSSLADRPAGSRICSPRGGRCGGPTADGGGMNLADLCARRVAVWGIGREGSAMVELLTGQGVQPVLIDDHPDAARDRLEASGPGSQVVLAPHQVEWGTVEVVVRAPGVSRYRPELLAAIAAGVSVTTAMAVWLEDFADARVVAITGTKGKSTTAALTHSLLRAPPASTPSSSATSAYRSPRPTDSRWSTPTWSRSPRTRRPR